MNKPQMCEREMCVTADKTCIFHKSVMNTRTTLKSLILSGFFRFLSKNEVGRRIT